MTIEELAPGLWRWTARHPEWHPGEFGREVAAYAARDGDETLLIDPIVTWPTALDGIVAGRVSILVTVPYHARDAESLAARYGARVHGHPAVAKRFSDPSALVADGDLPGGVRAFAVGRPRRHERPLWLPSHRALVFGDTVVEAGGELRVWDEAPASERRDRFVRERLVPTLEPLLELDPERILVTHGRPILARGRDALTAALAAGPWRIRS